ncbi:NINE protein [Rhodococcus sp. HNM0569]|uniref:NINE protein n=1 Tax=Rhodococcus sp. HNM0569 TaxID=2716340 RepID=UPI00146F3D13|nr:NINE protein [Rhodococcus sp. HNM0569]NLU82988.1 NINE protein [Rhodococcus sp. HNM0569]
MSESDKTDPGKSPRDEQNSEAGASGGDAAPDFGEPFDYDATAEASLSQAPTEPDATPAPGSTGTGPGWDTYAGVGNGPGWGNTPTYPAPSESAGQLPPPAADGPTYGTPDPDYSSDYREGTQAGWSGGASGAPDARQPEQPYPQTSYPQQPYPGQQSYAQQPYTGPQAYPAGAYQGGGWSTDPSAPYGRDPMTGEPLSDKSKSAAGLLQLLPSFVGVCGVGRLYLGHTGTGLAQLLLMFLGYALMLLLVGFVVVPVIWIWNLVDAIMMFSGSVRDSSGRPLRG